jgi:DNA replication and repair protein RecF
MNSKPRKFIAKLKLKNFRNHEEFSDNFSKNHVVIIGKNGSGKTNILEAISLLNPGRGIRKARLSELQSFSSEDEQPWSIFAEIMEENSNDTTKLATGLDPQNPLAEKRIAKINGEKIRGHAGLADYISIVSLTPAMDQVFVSSNSAKRDYLDDLTAIFYSEHLSHIAVYNNSRRERLNLLKRARHDDSWITAIEKRMAERAMIISTNRINALKLLQNAIFDDDNLGKFPKAILKIEGLVESYLKDYTAIEAENLFENDLKMSRNEDLITGKTNAGAHKSEFIVYHSAKKLPADLCSTGEQKAMLLSITLAAVKAKTSYSNATPILLLDEVIAHLDEQKRSDLFAEIAKLNCQAWMTGTEEESFKDILDFAHVIRF